MKFAHHRHFAQSPWRSLALGLWLFSFVFSFAFSDCFHSATCPEHALLKWAAHAGQASVRSGTSHAAQADVDCLACALGCVALALVTVSALVLIFVRFTLSKQPVPFVRATFLPSLPIARGPPCRA